MPGIDLIKSSTIIGWGGSELSSESHIWYMSKTPGIAVSLCGRKAKISELSSKPDLPYCQSCIWVYEKVLSKSWLSPSTRQELIRYRTHE